MIRVSHGCGGHTGLGYTYSHTAAATLIRQKLADVVQGADALAVEQRWADLYRAVRNIGRKGLASYAIAAVDIALWDLKARLLGVSAATLLGRVHEDVPIYGTGGFTSTRRSGCASSWPAGRKRASRGRR